MALSSANGHVSLSMAGTGSVGSSRRAVDFCNGELMAMKLKNLSTKQPFHHRNKAVNGRVCMSLTADFASDAMVSTYYYTINSFLIYCFIIIQILCLIDTGYTSLHQ